MSIRAWVVREPGPIEEGPLALVERPVPEPGPGEVLVRVSACGVCRTDLHVVEGDLAPRRPDIVPGHEVVGVVEALGPQALRLRRGQRVGIAWLRHTCGVCRFCRSGAENLCQTPLFTGWDEDGGYAEYAVVDERYAYELPATFTDEEVAPLLCAGIIGYRALKRANVPPRGCLGIYGFGGSAHLAAQIALAQGARVHVMTRSEKARALALELGAASARPALEAPPEPLDSAILFAPEGALVPVALAALERGGTLSIAGIHLTQIPPLDYRKHLFQERNLVSVTANTREDGRELLEAAARIPIKVATQPFPFERADEALAALAHGEITGAAVLRLSPR